MPFQVIALHSEDVGAVNKFVQVVPPSVLVTIGVALLFVPFIPTHTQVEPSQIISLPVCNKVKELDKPVQVIPSEL